MLRGFLVPREGRARVFRDAQSKAQPAAEFVLRNRISVGCFIRHRIDWKRRDGSLDRLQSRVALYGFDTPDVAAEGDDY